MIQFAEAFPEEEIVAHTVATIELVPLSRAAAADPALQREFYAEMSRIEGWSVPTMSERIDSMLYERTALWKHSSRIARLSTAWSTFVLIAIARPYGTPRSFSTDSATRLSRVSEPRLRRLRNCQL
jgi:hypothetical protein